MSRCLYCYDPLQNGEQDFHPACSKKIFDQAIPPVLPYSENDFDALGKALIESHHTVTGVQKKLSVHLTEDDKKDKNKRFTIVGLWGSFILKPPSANYPQLPEVEDLTMHLAKLAKIKTAPHTLIRMSSGNRAYITKRMDRFKKRKLAMEDMCQLTERLTEDKYQGSYEQVAKAIKKYSSTPGLDIVNFFEIVLFSFLTGNADMHLKNFSLLENSDGSMTLSPAYDLVNTTLVNPADDEDLALTLNAKKKKIRKQDFIAAMNTVNLEAKQQQNIFSKLISAKAKWVDQINNGFLTDDFKKQYIEIVSERIERMV